MRDTALDKALKALDAMWKPVEVTFDAENGYEPTRAHDTDAGWDLRATTDTHLPVEGSAVVGTGVKVNIPHGHVGLVFARSSMGFKYNVTLANSVGVIDAGFTGEIKVKLANHGHQAIAFDRGDRVAQLVIVPLSRVNMVPGDMPTTERGTGGFGSSGK